MTGRYAKGHAPIDWSHAGRARSEDLPPLGREIIEQEKSAFARDCAIERLLAIRNIAGVLARMEELGETEMGHLTHNEASSFHATTDKLRRLVDRLYVTTQALEG